MSPLTSVPMPAAQLAVLLAAGRAVQAGPLAPDTAARLADALRVGTAALEQRP